MDRDTYRIMARASDRRVLIGAASLARNRLGLTIKSLSLLLGLYECLLCPLALLALLVQFFAQVFAFLAFLVHPLAQAADDLQTLSILKLVLGQMVGYLDG